MVFPHADSSVIFLCSCMLARVHVSVPGSLANDVIHTHVYSNLDDRTREVYRENVQMAEALSFHMEHEASLRKTTEQLEMANRQLVAEKELNQQLVKEKIAQARQHKKLIRELQVGTVSLSHLPHTLWCHGRQHWSSVGKRIILNRLIGN